MENIKILIADDHQLIIEGIKTLLEDVEGITITDVATNGREVIEKLKYQEVDIILMDIDMPIMNGYEATQLVLKKYPHIKVIALTMYDEKALITKIVNAGASGYILKNIRKEELLKAITKVANGEKYFSNEILFTLSKPELKDIISEKQNNIPIVQLTQREIEVLKLITQGLSNKEIGEKLFISPRTVDTHRTNLMQKLNVHNIAGLIRYAIKNGLVD